MTLEQALALIRGNFSQLRGLGVAHVSIFGSFARGEARDNSDIDVLVEFERPVGLFRIVEAQEYLRELLGRSVDIATPGALREEIRPAILQEAIRAA